MRASTSIVIQKTYNLCKLLYYDRTQYIQSSDVKALVVVRIGLKLDRFVQFKLEYIIDREGVF
jgi:hypothetical protein